MTPQQFVAKWSKIQQKETAVDKGHFYDVCELVGHLKPEAYDPTGNNFSFQAYTLKPDGQKGFADVYFRDHFIWEYKGPHKDLDKAYAQLQLYRESLQNPPLLITSDIHTIVIHTNFNNYPTVKYTITFDDILRGEGVEKLRWAFLQPERFRPDKMRAEITKASADTFIAVADAMKVHQKETGERYTAEQLAHFLVRLLFCLFAEDLGLLPDNVFSKMVNAYGERDFNFPGGLRNLFREMRGGGLFGFHRIREFNGSLFDDEFVPAIPDDLALVLLQAADQNWAQVDPAIFGTLFERVIDQEKRAQLGAHYTSVADIMLIVEPVLMEPLYRRWDEVRRQVDRELRQVPGTANTTSSDEAFMAVPGTSYQLLTDFAAEIAAVRVLDPACGSGNFLYVALRQLLDLQKQVIAYAARRGLPEIPLTVSPEQLLGIEINPYAHELAQITAWIGYLQWRYENGFAEMPDPVLRPLRNIRRMDAILAYDEQDNPTEPEWPPADVIIGNPPFLGGNKIRQELGDQTVDSLFMLYDMRVPAFADLVCYWFEKARAHIERGHAQRAGLIATNSIRGGVNREVLKRIKQSGDIFMAWSDNPWILDGAAVRVSIVGFGDRDNNKYTPLLDGQVVSAINADLSKSVDLTTAIPLAENRRISMRTDEKGGPFDISDEIAQKMLMATNQSGRSNSDVIFPWVNGLDIVRRNRNMWIIDFGVDTPKELAEQYQMPFEYVEKHVRPEREDNRIERLREQWWLHRVPGAEMRQALSELRRFIVTPAVAKHRIFVWLNAPTMPDHQLYAFAREDDYFFGVLHSKLHEVWALRLGTWLGKGNDPRYTPTTTFETFPFPWPPGQEPAESDEARVAEIAHWARALHTWRDAWLNPPPPPGNAIDVTYNKMVQNRTLTNLYNGLVYYRETVKAGGGLFQQSEFNKVTRGSVSRAEIQELDDMHTALDNAVLDAYGWPHHLTDEEILERLLALNLQRAAGTAVSFQTESSE